MEQPSRTRVNLGIYLILVAGAALIVSALVPGFKVTGLQGLVNTTEKLWNDWEGKVALAMGVAMIIAAALMLVMRSRGTTFLLSSLAAAAALVALASGSYGISVFHSKTVEALAKLLSAKQGAPLEQARAGVKAAANGGALQMSGKIGIYLLIVSASVGFLAAAFVMAKSRRVSEPAESGTAPAPSAVAQPPVTDRDVNATDL